MTQKTAAWKRGFDDYNAGVVVGDNPFDENDDLHFEWMRGWVSSATVAKKRPL
jgi:hypothetical protein